MLVPQSNPENRRFTELVEEAKRMIPGLAPSWTDHNPSDPGITLIELFAFIAEILSYRADRVTEANKRAFVKLLRGPKYNLQQSIDEEIRLAVLELRQEQRAITCEDFQELAKTNPLVARAHCLPDRNLESGAADKTNWNEPVAAHISVLIVPFISADFPPKAEKKLCDNVLEFLRERCLLTTRLHVVSASYLKLTVNIVVQIFTDRDETKMENLIRSQLANYFSPLSGGISGQGWPFGQAVYVSKLYAFLDGIDGLDYVIAADDKRVLVAENNLQSDRRILENAGEKLIGIRLKPNELVDFDQDHSSIVVKRPTTITPKQ